MKKEISVEQAKQKEAAKKAKEARRLVVALQEKKQRVLNDLGLDRVASKTRSIINTILRQPADVQKKIKEILPIIEEIK